MPWEGLNALNAAQLLFHGVDMLRQHVRPDVRMHGIYTNGGTTPNIVPEVASAHFYIRALEKEYLESLVSQIDRIAEGAALMTGTTWSVKQIDAPYDNLKHNLAGEQLLTETFHELNIAVDSGVDEIIGSSDIGNVSFICPTFHPTLQLVEKGIATHTKEFSDVVKTPKAHDSIKTAAEIIALYIAKTFSRTENIQWIKSDFS